MSGTSFIAKIFISLRGYFAREDTDEMSLICLYRRNHNRHIRRSFNFVI